MDGYELIPPWWVSLVAGLTLAGTGVLLYRWVVRDEVDRVGARVRSVAAAIVFSFAIAVTGWGSWLLAALPPREVVFAVIWVFVAGYFVVAAGTFKTQMKRYDTSAGATARHLLQALLWGPIMVLMLLPPRRELPRD